MTRALRAGAWLLAALLCACSAMGLGDYERVPCTPHEECEALSASLPAEACERYYCTGSGRGCELRPTDLDDDQYADEGTCRDELAPSELDCDDGDRDRHPGQGESCNGRDDDCDGFIDEGMKLIEGEGGQQTMIGAGVVDVAHAQLGDGTEVFALTRRGETVGSYETSRVVIENDEPSDPSPLFAADVVLCQQAEGLDPERCGLSQLALGGDSELLLAAGIHRAGCGAGQLRVGVGDQGALGAALAAPPSASNVAFGVDVDANSGCTSVGPCQGASYPVLAVLPDREGDPTQALALFRPQAAEGDSCDTTRGTPLMGLGLFLEGSGGSPFLVGSAGGRAEPLGEHPATGPAALLALDAGYLVAYPALDRVELLFVPRLEGQDSAPESDRQLGLDAEGAQGAALAGAADGASGLGVAFRSGHGMETPLVHFSKLTFDPGDVPHITAEGSMVTLRAEGEIVTGPLLAYAAKGFVAEDSSGPKGGWLIMWIEQTSDGRTLKAARIADKEQRKVPEPYELARGDDLSHPFVYSKRGAGELAELRYGFVGAGFLQVNRLKCEEP